MNKTDFKKGLSALMTGIIYVGMGFSAGFWISEFFLEDTMPPAETVSAVETAPPALYTPAPAVITPEPEYYGVRYLVKAEGDELKLYETDAEHSKILRKSKINMNNFPVADVGELKNGINTGTLEGALEIWESFME